jgi:hypothetical protein
MPPKNGKIAKDSKYTKLKKKGKKTIVPKF